MFWHKYKQVVGYVGFVSKPDFKLPLLDQLQFWWSETNPTFGYFRDGVAKTMAPIPSIRWHRGVKSHL